MTEFGIFTDEGCIESGFYSEAEAQAAIDDRYPDEWGAQIVAVCPDHEEERIMRCESCLREQR